MQCPYCISNINDAAVVCPVCRRDLYLLKPLQEKVAELEQKVKEGDPARNKALEARLAELEDKLSQRESSAAPAPLEASAGASPRSYLLSALIAALASLALLLAAHGLIVILYDLKTLYLRIASLLIPLPLGFALHAWHPRRFWASSLVAVLVACAAVLGMSAITGYVDKTPVLPENLREWREFIEYAASITFSFITGLLLGKLRRHQSQKPAQPSRVVILIAQLFAKHEDGQLGVQKLVTRITTVAGAVAPAVSGAVSVYTGIKAVLGNS
jgi:hypothetical protein